ncbi:hypothetical protein [Labilithrix luteola]|nr:hypothetical protein [Labilithrix luteola]
MTNSPGFRSPSHPPTTPAQWAGNEAAAKEAAQKAGATELAPPVHMVAQTGGMVMQHFPVAANTCYELGIAWSYPATLNAHAGFENKENLQLGGRSAKIDAPAGVLHFCTDKLGSVLITLSSITPAGPIANAELLEYAVVVGSWSETPEQTAARRKEETEKAAATQAWMDANVARANAREEADRKERCHRCDEDYRACQVNASYRRSHPARGVSFTESCESKFTSCSFGGEMFDRRETGKKPCGDPPR